VKLVVFDLVGREVATLANGRYPGGRYEFKFNASNLTSGVYLCRLLARPEAAGGTAEIARTQKMLLVR
jgi:hypothetical protein